MAGDISVGNLVLGIKTKLDEFKSDMREAQGTVQGFASSIETNQKSLLVAGGALAGMGTAILGTLGMFAKQAGDEEIVFNRLKNTVEINGMAWDEAKPKIDAFTASLQATTRYGDDQTAGILNKLVIYTGDLSKAMQGTKIAMDMGASGMFDVDMAARLVGMAMNGNIEILARYIPEFKSSTNEALKNMDANEKAAYALAVLQEKFGGMADKELNTFNAQWARTQNYLGDAVELIGYKLLPVINSFLETFTTVVRKVIEFSEEHQTLISVLIQLAATVGTVALALGGLMLGAAGLPLILSTFSALGVALAATGPVGLALAGTAAAVMLIVMNWDTLYKLIMTSVQKVYGSIRWLLDKVGIELPEMQVEFEKVSHGATRTWEESSDKMAKKTKETTDAVVMYQEEADAHVIAFREHKNQLSRDFETDKFRESVAAMLADEEKQKEESYERKYQAWLEQEEKNKAAFEARVDEDVEYFMIEWEETVKTDLPSVWKRAWENMADYLNTSVKSGGAIFGGLQNFKNTLANVFSGVAQDFAGDIGGKLQSKLSEVFQGMGAGIATIASQITTLGVQAAAGIVINKVAAAVTPDYEAMRKGREWQAAFTGGEKIFTFTGAEARLGESEFGWSEESLAKLQYDISAMYGKYGSKEKAPVTIRAAWQAMEENFNVARLNALAGYGLEELRKAVADNPNWIAEHWGTAGFNMRMLADLGAAYSSKAQALPHFAAGGYISDTGLIFAHAGEGILNRKAMEVIGGQTALNRVNESGVPGGITVNITGNQINSELDMRRLARLAGEEVMRSLKYQVQFAR